MREKINPSPFSHAEPAAGDDGPLGWEDTPERPGTVGETHGDHGGEWRAAAHCGRALGAAGSPMVVRGRELITFHRPRDRVVRLAASKLRGIYYIGQVA